MLLYEFDENKIAVVNSSDIINPVSGMPKIAVTCFSRETFRRLVEEMKGEKIASTSFANMLVPIYKANYKGKEIALFMSSVGAPACVALLEDVFVMGVEKVVMFGTCGVLDSEIGDCSIIIPDAAMRDEGTSFHYAPASDEIAVNEKYMDEFIDILHTFDCKYTLGKVWTTDGVYRETREKVNRRKEQGCICVDMECSAVSAVAKFRGKEVFQFFYAADNQDSEVWDARSLGNTEKLSEKDKVAMLAMELAVRI